MFQILPVSPEELAPLFDGQALPPGALPMALRLTEGEEEKGLGRLYILPPERQAVLLSLTYPAGDPALADALLRAMLNFAGRRGAEWADFTPVMEDSAVRIFGYAAKTTDGKLSIDAFFGQTPPCGGCCENE